jgi:hypothetical protein
VSADRERKRFVDGLAILTFVAMFIAVAIPWFIGRADIDLAGAARWAFAISAIYLVIAVVLDRWAPPRLMHFALLGAPIVAAVMTAILWHFSGGIERPALLGFLTLPVLAASIIPARWPLIVTAAVAIIGAVVVAVIEVPALGWYLSQTGIPTSWIVRFAPQVTTARTVAPPSELYGSLVVAAVAIITVAASSRKLGDFVRRAAAIATGGARDGSEPLLERGFRSLPLPTVVIAADTAQIVDGSDSFFQRMLLTRNAVVGQEIAALLRFDDSRSLNEAIADGGRIAFARYAVGAEERVASVEVERFGHAGSGYAAVTIRDWNDLGYLAAAADSVEEPLLLIGTNDGRLRYANRAANAAFGDLYVGRDMSWLADSGDVRTRIPVQLFASEPATLLAFAPRAAEA